MAAGGSTRIIFIAMAANFGIACAKFGAAAWTGSSAMLSEAIHSLVDTSNQVLLLIGLKRATKKADAKHPFGYSKELYFWSFIVAILLFSLGSGVSLYEGIEKFFHPHPIKNADVIYIVLGIAIGMEGFSTYKALAEFRKRHSEKKLFTALQKSKDPALFAIVLEDIAAMTGLFVALIGVLIADKLGYDQADGIASIVIGLVLAAVAIFMAIEIKGLIIGEAADPEIQTGLFEIITNDHGPIKAINEIRTMHLGPTDILVAVSVDFHDGVNAETVEETTGRIEQTIKETYPSVRKLFIEVQSIESHAAALERDKSETGPAEKTKSAKAAAPSRDTKKPKASSQKPTPVEHGAHSTAEKTREATSPESPQSSTTQPKKQAEPALSELPSNRKTRKSRRKARRQGKKNA